MQAVIDRVTIGLRHRRQNAASWPMNFAPIFARSVMPLPWRRDACKPNWSWLANPSREPPIRRIRRPINRGLEYRRHTPGKGMSAAASIDAASVDVIAALGFTAEMATLRQRIAAWVAACDPEMREALEWQFLSGSKYFRPLTIFACYRSSIPAASGADHDLGTGDRAFSQCVAGDRRHCGPLRHAAWPRDAAYALWGTQRADGLRLHCRRRIPRLGDDLQAIGLFSELLKRLGVAECMQWRLRRQKLGVEDWRRIAGEDTGSMFEVCACLGDRSSRLRKFGGLLGLLYAAATTWATSAAPSLSAAAGRKMCGTASYTLPAALAIRDPEIGALFCKRDPDTDGPCRHCLRLRCPTA